VEQLAVKVSVGRWVGLINLLVLATSSAGLEAWAQPPVLNAQTTNAPAVFLPMSMEYLFEGNRKLTIRYEEGARSFRKATICLQDRSVRGCVDTPSLGAAISFPQVLDIQFKGIKIATVAFEVRGESPKFYALLPSGELVDSGKFQCWMKAGKPTDAC
jgi:hypothetical protein